jgi:hypothetical protein
MVFRNADGTKEAKASQDMTIENAYIAANGDIFMKVEEGDQVVGIEDDFNMEPLRLYPNPADGTVRLETIVGQAAQVDVVNLNGQVVVSQKVVDSLEEIKVNHIPAGLYIVKVTMEDGSVERGKLMIRR